MTKEQLVIVEIANSSVSNGAAGIKKKAIIFYSSAHSLEKAATWNHSHTRFSLWTEVSHSFAN